MKISAQEEYGLRCLLQLARSGAPLTIPEVAKKEGLSMAYVGKLFFLLRRAGLVTSHRGARGGYGLAASADQITLARAFAALSGPQRRGSICEEFPGRKKECVHVHGSCSVRSVWNKIYKSIWGVLDTTTLADLLEEESVLDRSLETRFSIKEIPLEFGGQHAAS